MKTVKAINLEEEKIVEEMREQQKHKKPHVTAIWNFPIEREEKESSK